MAKKIFFLLAIFYLVENKAYEFYGKFARFLFENRSYLKKIGENRRKRIFYKSGTKGGYAYNI